MVPAQLAWLEKELQNSKAAWKICYFHHPLYSSGAFHGASSELRLLLEPLFVKYGVQVVFAGHEHVYERSKLALSGNAAPEGKDASLEKTRRFKWVGETLVQSRMAVALLGDRSDVNF